MSGFALYVLAAVLALAVSRARLERAFLVVTLTLLVVPAYLLVPVQGAPWTRVTRIVVAAYAVSLVVRARRGEIDRAALRLPRMILAVVLGAVVIGAVGVGLAYTRMNLQEGVTSWLIFADQAVMAFAALVTTRVLGGRKVVDLLLVAGGVALLIGIGEQFSGSSWSSVFPSGDAQSSVLANPLEQRGGARIRSGALFALEFGWVVAILVPLAIQRFRVRAAAHVQVLLAAALFATPFVLVWTRSRSALAAGAAAAVLLVAGTRFERRIAVPVVLGALLAGAVLFTSDAFHQIYDIDRPTEATEQDVRVDRLPGILEEASASPITGLGLGGLRDAGYVTPDNGWLLLYVDAGVIGLAVYAAVALLGIAACARNLRAPKGDHRDLGAAVLAGAVLWLAANAAYDASNLGLSGPLFWLLVGTGAAMAEQVPRARTDAPALSGAVVALAAVGASVAVAALAPTHVARWYQFQHLPTQVLARTDIAYTRPGHVAAAAVCDVMDEVDRREPAGRIDCVEPGVYQPSSGRYSVFSPGTGRLRAEAPHREGLDRLEDAMEEAGDMLVHFELRPASLDQTGSPTPLRTAPVWVGVGSAFLLLFWPRETLGRGPAR